MPDQKHTSLVMLQANLAHFEADPASFFLCFRTQDECWVHHFEPETKQQSMQRNYPSSPRSSSGMQMALCSLTTFRRDNYQEGILCGLAAVAAKGNQVKLLGKLTTGVLFHQDNAPAHKSAVEMVAVHDYGFELVDHLPYSPDLAPSEYFLFPNMKKPTWLGSSIGPMMRSCLQLRTFLRIRMKASIYHRNPSTSTSIEEVCGWQARLWLKINHILSNLATIELWTAMDSNLMTLNLNSYY